MRGGHGAVASAPGACSIVGKIGAEEAQFQWVPGMNCTEFESVVVEIARGEIADLAAHREGVAHAQNCARCARRLANEQMLSRIVADAVAEDSAHLAPPRVEKMLAAAFREQRSALVQHRGAWLPRVVMGTIAAMLILAAVVALRKPDERQAVQVKSERPQPVPQPVKVLAPVYREVRRPQAPTLHASRRKTARQPEARPVPVNREVMTDFIPVVYDPEPIERGRIVRVRLPRSALADFGLPMNEQHAEEPIKADVLLGEDGLARAVRFIR